MSVEEIDAILDKAFNGEVEKEAVKIDYGKYCKRLEDAYPGTISSKGHKRPVWQPENCELAPLDNLGVEKCFSKLKQVWLGDSLTRDVARKIARFGLRMVKDMHFFTPEDKGPKYADAPVKGQVYSHVYTPSAGGEFAFYWSAAALYDGSLNFTITQKAIAEADIVMVGGGMWDMGVLFLPPDSYFDVMRKRLENIKAVMKPGASLIVFPVHYLHIDRCPVGKRCRLCNDPFKAKVFREALSLAAGCVGATVLDTTPVTKAAPYATNDGAHYDKFISLIQADMYLNRVCRDPPMELATPPRCNPEEAKARWKRYPTAYEGCRGPAVDPFAR